MNQSQTQKSPPHLDMKKVWRIIIILPLLFISFIFYEQQSRYLTPNDFIRYWSSATLLLNNENPYDSDRLYDIQVAGGFDGQEKISLYNPPWIFPIITPFGLFDRQFSQLLWLLVNIAIVLICSNQLWRHLQGKSHLLWLAWLMAFSFGPTFAALGYTGQITPFFLLGFSGFLLLIDRPNKDWLTGLCLIFAAIKPQVPYLFFILFFIWAVHLRRWKLIISFTAGLMFATAFGMVFDKQILSHFLLNLTGNTPVAWATPTIGAYLRYYLGFKDFWIQFVPPLITGILSIFYWYRNRNNWDWQTAMPWILFLSLITSPYTWTYDFVVLIIPLLISLYLLLHRISRLPAFFLAGFYIIINSAYWWLHLKYTDFYFIWFAPALLLWFIMVQALSKYQKSIP